MTAAEVAEVMRMRGISASGSPSRGAFDIARRPFGSQRQYETK